MDPALHPEGLFARFVPLGPKVSIQFICVLYEATTTRTAPNRLVWFTFEPPRLLIAFHPKIRDCGRPI